MGPGGQQQQRQKREQKAEAEAAVRCGRCSRRLLLFLSSRFPSIDESDSRQSTRRRKDYKGGIKRKRQKMGV